ncbi:hypothetical protein Ctha_2326 [Chloroherpeton thalassium ATCC 35110]|uniref:Uncharacterized protein n=1 Tax=Chloroherpeton thalassium (strain ATCC 35110 / GB-78) TaxID=517418 RepID=B3QWL6_CHLT3|nr:hypothetical protein [Chloroherpeton thalassium]ACF14776.1 hypothetical protein Ctha_2326 [Chloroherpeton thalassium ATCC 35110]
MATSLILPIGFVSFLFILIGIYISVRDGGKKNLHVFDFFFLGATVLAFVLANYLWFLLNDKQTGILVGIWAVGNATLGLYFRIMFSKAGNDDFQ